ncbi:hypothetical protein [Aureimonas ureilytica]|uniref:hypothetical protein n=1 Tax=Aureimonas ureilytica TaxID=401562 RepID=UPI000361925B|nr:hypothetical protein [Aureimonas ureilytica]
MIGNIVDHRTDRATPECDAVFEPSSHDCAKRPDGMPWFDYDHAAGDPSYFHALDSVDTTVRDAVLQADKNWPFAVTVYLYDKGTRPLG